jgi:cytoskeletal protein CcmA (bactofilin family)
MSIFSKNSPQNNSDDKIANGQADDYSDAASASASTSTEEQVAPYEQAVRNELGNRSGIAKPSIISEGFTFEGTITSDGVLNIAGTVRGKVTAKSILIDASGQVDGELNSEQLVIKGQLKGEVNCDDLNIGPLARVDGSISYKYIHIQRGSKVSGKFIKN